MGRPPEGSKDLRPWLAERLVPVMKPGEENHQDYVDAQVTQDAEAEDRAFLEKEFGKLE